MANRFKVWPEQIGPLLLGDGVAGPWLTVRCRMHMLWQPWESVIVTV